MNTPIVAVHLTYPEGQFPAQERWISGVGWEYTPELHEETLCAECARNAWHLTPEEGDADLVKAAQHLTKGSHLAERIDLLEQDMVPAGWQCRACHKVLSEEGAVV